MQKETLWNRTGIFLKLTGRHVIIYSTSTSLRVYSGWYQQESEVAMGTLESFVSTSRLTEFAPGPLQGFKEGDVDTALNKTIKVLITYDRYFVVYLDQDYNVEWLLSRDFELSLINTNMTPDDQQNFWRNYSAVVGEISQMEVLSSEMLPKRHIPTLRRFLGEALARALEAFNNESGKNLLETAKSYMEARSKERARLWVMAVATVGLLLSIGCIWIFNVTGWLALVLKPDIAFTLPVLPFGAIGAVVSLAQRSGTFAVDPMAGRTLHFIEASFRIIIGAISAFLLALAVKTDFVMSLSNELAQPKQVLMLFLIAIVAGTSERILPSIISKVEGGVSGAGQPERTNN